MPFITVVANVSNDTHGDLQRGYPNIFKVQLGVEVECPRRSHAAALSALVYLVRLRQRVWRWLPIDADRR